MQRRFLREVGLTDEEALLQFNLAFLNARRDMAALGLIHRTVLGLGPPHFREWFFPSDEVAPYPIRHQVSKHTRQLYSYVRGNQTELLKRSLLGQVQVYNKLAQNVVDCGTVKTFQRQLKQQLKVCATAPSTRRPWQLLFSVRDR